MQQSDARRVVVLGGGFAGISAMARLAGDLGRDPRVDLLLVDKNNYQLFTPMLHEAATALIEPLYLLRPIRPLAVRMGFRFQESEAREIDLTRKIVNTDDGPISYDYLVICLGSVPNFWNVSGAEINALTFKTAEDAVRIRSRILEAFEEADISGQQPDRRRRLLAFAIAGGGATGVELAAAMHDFIHHDLIDLYPSIRFDDVGLTLLEGSGRLLSDLDPGLAAISRQALERKRVDVRLNTPVTSISGSGARTSTGEEIPAATVIWTAGVRTGTVVGALPVDKDAAGRIIVDESLEIPGHPNVFAIGDNCRFQYPQDEKPLPPNAQVAIQQGLTAACSILWDIQGRPKCVFSFRPMADLVSLGRRAGVADLFGFRFHGPTAWLLWKTVYLLRLASYENKAQVLFNWLLVAPFQRNISRLAGFQSTGTLKIKEKEEHLGHK